MKSLKGLALLTLASSIWAMPALAQNEHRAPAERGTVTADAAVCMKLAEMPSATRLYMEMSAATYPRAVAKEAPSCAHLVEGTRFEVVARDGRYLRIKVRGHIVWIERENTLDTGV